MEGLICPKCHGEMRTYERSGVTVDQCTECRGIFLDRGELERLTDAETSHFAPEPEAPPQRQPDRRERDDDDDYRYREREYRETYGGQGHHRKRKKRSFLEELFD